MNKLPITAAQDTAAYHHDGSNHIQIFMLKLIQVFDVLMFDISYHVCHCDRLKVK